MSGPFAYDQTYDPPAPVVSLSIARPGEDAGVLVRGLVDSGADCTLIPSSIARALALPMVGRLHVLGVGGGGGSAPTYAGRVVIGGIAVLARLVAYEDEVIVGRDLLNRIVTVLDGPRLQLAVSRS